MDRNILTIATGKKLYVDMATNLARSFIFWHNKTDINFIIVTDNPTYIPSEVRNKVTIKQVTPGELGEGFSSKLHLDHLSPEGQTLFIDSDCLIFGNLDQVFERFKGHKVSVVGTYISDGEWFGDIGSICKQYGLAKLPKFNGGIYYVEKGEIASEVYATAREIEKKYDEIGFVRLRNKPNDEVIMALAMALQNQCPINDDGSIMSDPLACRGRYEIDVISGKRCLTNPPYPSPLNQKWYPFSEVSPLVVHFLGYFTQHYPYRREVFRLSEAVSGRLKFRTELESLIKIEYPARLTNFIKNTFRPAYHSLFGPRKIKQSERL